MNEYTESTQFIDLSAQQKTIRSDIDTAIKTVLDHGQYIMGPEVRDFENRLSEYTRANHVISCANGTDALSIVLMAWGVGKGDAVFVPSFTYVASAEAPAQLGATPFFVDVCEETYNIDLNSFKQAIIDCKEMGLNPKVVIPVDLFGRPVDIDPIHDVAQESKIKTLIDGAQSFGASIDGRKVGSMGDATTTSFFPAKPLGCYGDGGAIFTNNDKDADIIKSIRLHGKGKYKYDNVRIGLNSRLDTIQAAILIEKLKIFPNELINREKLSRIYNQRLCDVFITPKIPDNIKSAWAQYTVITESRNNIQQKLKEKGIPTVIYYPFALSEQKGYEHYPVVSSGLINSEKLSKKVLSLPMHPYMKKETTEFIVQTILEIKKN